jgi:hypothetical protein
VAETIRLGTDKPVEVGQFERPPQIGVRVQFKRVEVEPKGSREENGVLNKGLQF